MRTLHWSASGEVLVSEEDFERLNLENRRVQSAWASKIQSHIGVAPLLVGRENSVRVGLTVTDQPRRELIAA